MNRSELILHFADGTNVPVDVNDVVKVLHDNGHQADIEFIGVDLDPDILQGKIKIFYVRNGVYADPIRTANIYYHRGHDPDWERFICCKELMHLLDPTAAETSTPEAIDELAEKIGLPPEMQDPVSDGFATNVDRVAEFRAAAILLPMAVRDALMPAYQDDKITLADIARLADIPRKYVGLVMSSGWPQIHDILTEKK